MIGTDVVDVERLRRALESQPGLCGRLFDDQEIAHCRGRGAPESSFAGILAAKEAAMKALGLASLPAWARRIHIRHDGGAPVAEVQGRGEVAVSIAHDGGVAVAVAFAGKGLRLPGETD